MLALTTLRDPMDCSLPGSSVHGISQARKWSGLSFPLLGGSLQLSIQTHISCVFCIGRWILYLPSKESKVNIRSSQILHAYFREDYGYSELSQTSFEVGCDPGGLGPLMNF